MRSAYIVLFSDIDELLEDQGAIFLEACEPDEALLGRHVQMLHDKMEAIHEIALIFSSFRNRQDGFVHRPLR